ncbi:hypothetical protein ACSNOD_31820, partial [Streptomyces sp. URMC 123]
VLDGGKLVAEGTADELKRLIPGGHIRLRFADAWQLGTAARLFDTGLAVLDTEALTLDLPGDGGIPTLRTVLDVLDSAAVKAEALTVHTPDLDDVFLALTGRPGASHTARSPHGPHGPQSSPTPPN